MAADLQAAAGREPGYPRVVLISLASVEANREFFAERWPAATVIADPTKALFAAFGRRRGSLLQLFGPRTFAAAFRAWRKGHRVGRARGDTLVMPGVFVVDGARVLYEHPFRDAGDHPDFARLPELAGLQPAGRG
ncbi:MAG: AhpC/TSA family protein [Planctomycetes bacterium]|nr:AhpC/TSA family protein [Planctomycetota bacterium]